MRTLLLFLALVTFSSAWPWPPSFHLHNALLDRRQDGGNETSSAKPGSSAASAAASETGSAAGTATGSDAPKETGKSGGGSGKSNSTRAGNDTDSAATTEVDERLPAGGIAMLTPAATSTTYYKIGEDVTLAWNYTSLEVTPSAIDVVASNTHGAWTLTRNASVKETNSVVWKTEDDKGGANPLLTDKYTLLVYDAAQGPTGVPKPGHLGSMVNFQFGMYLPRPYTPLAEFVCATCSGAMSQAEVHTLGAIVAMGTITVLSFTWFANGFLGAVP